MSTHFDYFFVLSALAFFLLLVLIVHFFRNSASQKSDQVQPFQIRRERIAARSTSTTAFKPELKEKEVRAATLVFYDECSLPVAVMSRATLGAQGWGSSRSEESSRLSAFINASFSTQDNEVLTLHYPQGNITADALKVKAFDEKGKAVDFCSTIALRGEDFPHYDENENLQTWLIETALTLYRRLFLKLDAVEQTKLIKFELLEKECAFLDEKLSPMTHLALSYLLLSKLAKESDFFVRMTRYNRIYSFFNSVPKSEHEAFLGLERLIISQTFVQTQKLPFFLIRTPTSCAQWSKALKY